MVRPRNIVNRVWSWLLGRGIIHEPDDIRPDNPPANPELLAFLEQELVAARYDLKHLLPADPELAGRTSCRRFPQPAPIPGPRRTFACYPLRRLEAEVLIDALVPDHRHDASSTPAPSRSRSPSSRRTSARSRWPTAASPAPFLEMFGRPPRDTGLESERNNRPTAAQRLHLLNSSHIQRKIEQSPKLQALLQAGRASRATWSTRST